MGAKDSKLTCISYEDAVKRLSDEEFRQVRDAVKKLGNSSGNLSRETFLRHVLGDNVPPVSAEVIYSACGGQVKGISFKDLICGLVVLVKGTVDERVRFLFNVYSVDGELLVTRSSMLRVVQRCESRVNIDGLNQLFGQCNVVGFVEFRHWILTHRHATELSTWLLTCDSTLLLSCDQETPTFCQSLAGVTHLEEVEVRELEQRYWCLKSQSVSGQLDRQLFRQLMERQLPSTLVESFFDAFDENRDGHVDFKEMACGVSAACRGPLAERHKFSFKVFDADCDGRLNKSELQFMVDILISLSNEALLPDVEATVREILSWSESGEYITQEEFLVWAVHNPLPDHFANLMFQICHVLLGLRPREPREECDVVVGWLCRQEALGYRLGSHWFLVHMAWWRAWCQYVGYQAYPCGASSCLTSGTISFSGNRSLALSINRDRKFKTDNSLAQDTGPVVMTSSRSFVDSATSSPHRLYSCRISPVFGSSCSPTASGATSLHALSSSPPRCSSSSHCSPVPPAAARADGSRPGAGAGDWGAVSVGADTPPSRGDHQDDVQTMTARRPGTIDNSQLVQQSAYKVPHLSSEGGRLRTDLILERGREFEIVPECLWQALQLWYGGAPALPRRVIDSGVASSPDLELTPLTLRLLRHQISPTSAASPSSSTSSSASIQRLLFNNLNVNNSNTFSGLLGGSVGSSAFLPSSAPKRYLAYTAAFSRLTTVYQTLEFIAKALHMRNDNIRLWHVKHDSSPMILWEDDSLTLEQLEVRDNDEVLVEVRNKDQTWPEEMCLIANLYSNKNKAVPIETGVTGLTNLGNTCFMNTALQCCSNTKILTRYFVNNMHLYELNRNNPIGMKGHIALCYGELIQSIWRGSAKVIAPVKLRCTIGKYASRFSGVQQHDAQELLSFLLDGLHEDLNRVQDKPYVELRDSEGRPDVVVAQEAWENHILRNKSIIVDLFHGQLKSKVTCRQCRHESVRFDPFNVLSLPLPIDDFTYVEIILVRMDGSVPMRYSCRVSQGSTYLRVKQHLHQLASLVAVNLLICEIFDGVIRYIFPDHDRIQTSALALYAFEIPACASRVYNFSDPSVGSVSDDGGMSRGSVDEECTRADSILDTDSASSEFERPDGSGLNAATGQDVTMVATDPGLVSSPFSSQPSSIRGGTPQEPGLVAADRTGASTCLCVDVQQLAPNMAGSHGSPGVGCRRNGYIIAYHRKFDQQSTYLVSTQKQRPHLFGLPVVVGMGTSCDDSPEPASGAALYGAVWSQVARLVSPSPPAAPGVSGSDGCTMSVSNHAQDCDDSLGYRYPFVLRWVSARGLACGICPWYRFCRGCSLAADSTASLPLSQMPAFLAIDWDPIALHLRYLTVQEKMCVDHESVLLNRHQQNDTIDLHGCLEAFTREETLTELEKYYCSRCRSHQPALKKLQIWKLPPLLIIHLKRFQYVAGRWIKSKKVVRFPFTQFDPTDYLASVPRQTILHHRVDTGDLPIDSPQLDWDVLVSQTGPPSSVPRTAAPSSVPPTAAPSSVSRTAALSSSVGGGGSGVSSLVRARNGSVNCGDCLQDFHRHRLAAGGDPLRPVYRLYALSSHTGLLSCGHYVCYAKNPDGHWYFYNDSACRSVSESAIDTSSAYLLFYEREALDCNSYMPKVCGSPVDKSEVLQECESELKSVCSLM